MSNQASPPSSPSKEAPNENEDELWEEAFIKMDEQEALFGKQLPSIDEDAKKVFTKFNDKSHVGPIVLAKRIPGDAFSSWLLESELGLHKAERLANGTVYVPQPCSPDHGILRGLLHKERYFPILNEDNASFLRTGSGSKGGQNPDVFWFRSDERSRNSRVLFEVGISQSLPDLRRRAYALCKASKIWVDLVYVVLVKRYQQSRLYIEIWRRIARQAGADEPDFIHDQRAPGDLDVTETMEFVANAHASAPGVRPNTMLSWQFDLPPNCAIPDGDDLLARGAAVTFDAQVFLDNCEYDDEE